MKLNRKILLGSALALALSANLVTPSKADGEAVGDSPASNASSVESNINSNEKTESNIDSNNKTENNTNNNETANTSEKNESKDKNKSNENSEASKEKFVQVEVKPFVKNRDIHDWLRDNTFISVNGDSYSFSRTFKYHNLKPGTYNVELSVLNGKTYAKGELKVPEFSEEESSDRQTIPVELKIVDGENTRNFDLTLMDKKKGVEYAPFNKQYVFINDKLYDTINGLFSFLRIKAVPGRTYKIDVRENQKLDSRLIARGYLETPAEGLMLNDDDLTVDMVYAEDLKEDKKDQTKPGTDTSKEDKKDQTTPGTDSSKKDKKDQTKPSKKDDIDTSKKDGKEEINPSTEADTNKKDKNNESSGLEKIIDIVKPEKNKLFDTQKEAEDAAKKALEENPSAGSYVIKQNKDGKFYFEPKEEEKQKPVAVKKAVSSNNNTGNSQAKPRKSSNVKTGIASVSGVVGVLAAAVGGFIYSNKRK